MTGGRPRVLHVIPSVAARYGGPSQAIAPMCRSLIAAGVDVTLATTDADGRARLDVPRGVVTEWEGVPTIFFRRDATESFKYSRGLGRWLRGHVQDYEVVHVHAVFSHASLAAAAACRARRVPYVVRPLGTIAQWSLTKKAWRKRVLFAVAAERMLAGAAVIHCTSDEEWRDAQTTLGLTRGTVIPLGVDADGYDPTSDDLAARRVRPYVLSLSRLDPKKNLEALIDAFVAVRSRVSEPWTLVIAGTGEERYARSLEAHARARGASDVVRFTGWVEGARKRELLARASLFALPSKHENFGVSVIEAAAAGVPAIVAGTVQLASAIAAAEAGWIVSSGAELETALAQAIGAPADRSAKGDAARLMSRRFEWPSIASALRTIYRDLAGAGATAPHAAVAAIAPAGGGER